MSTDSKDPITAEQLLAVFVLDAPVPIRLLYGLYGHRSTFHRWKKEGLDVKHVSGLGPTVIPSKFKVFLLRIRGDYAPAQPVEPKRKAKK
jgi:hypothetical protein